MFPPLAALMQVYSMALSSRFGAPAAAGAKADLHGATAPGSDLASIQILFYFHPIPLVTIVLSSPTKADSDLRLQGHVDQAA